MIKINHIISFVYTRGASPRRVDVRLGSAHVRNWRRCTKANRDHKCDTVVLRSTSRLSRVWIKTNKTLGSVSTNQNQIWPSGTRWRTVAGSSSSVAATRAVYQHTEHHQHRQQHSVCIYNKYIKPTSRLFKRHLDHLTIFYTGNKIHANKKR